MPKLVAIGDSLTQGVQSGAISKPQLSYPALIAEVMGLQVQSDFRVPTFCGDGIPLNIKCLLTFITQEVGPNIIKDGKWGTLLGSIRKYLNQVEYYYERGPGADPACYGGVYHNLAVSGFRVYDSYKVDSEYCYKQYRENKWWQIKNDFFQVPSAPTYRIAQRVLNPKRNPDRKNWTQIDNLKYLNDHEGGVDNLILFLGANDCLATVVKLDMKDMKGKRWVSNDPEKRHKKYNLTDPEVFKDNYAEMVERISDVISEKTKVFVGNVPHVTIPPITQGIGETSQADNGKTYYERYIPCFLKRDKFIGLRDEEFKTEEVQRIDDRIDEFNASIESIITNVPERGSWHVVDICGLLDELAVKRQNTERAPDKPLKDLLGSNHPLLAELEPTPSVLRFEMEGTQRTNGGLFSLDCFHPTTIGYGLIAETFLREMESKKVEGTKLTGEKRKEFWQRIIKKDPLMSSPPALWEHIFEIAKAHPLLGSLLQRLLTL